MSKSTVVPKVPSAKVLNRFKDYFDSIPKLVSASDDDIHTPSRIHDENEDRKTPVILDDLSPHARSALDRLLGKAHDPE